MVVAIVISMVGLGALLSAWVLPQLSDHLPGWFRIALVVSGLALIVGGAVLGVVVQRVTSLVVVHFRFPPIPAARSLVAAFDPLRTFDAGSR